MRRRWRHVGRGLAAVALGSGTLAAGAATPAAGQEVEEPVAAVEIHHSSVFDGAVQCPSSAVRYQPNTYWGVLIGDGAQGGTFLAAQCGDRFGILRMVVEDPDPTAGRPPGSIRVTITGFLFKAGLVPCSTQSVVVDVPDASGINFFDRTMTLFGCDTWWRTDMQVWYGVVPPSVFCPRPPVIWC
jgi:hypothetical protein